MDDYIKRSDALSEIDEWMESVGTALIGKGLSYYAELQGCIEDAPAADVEPVRRWIPVAERLPEKNKEVVGWYKDNPFSPFRYGIVSWNGHGWVFTYAQRYVDAVTYWMPLPEPPKEDSQCDT